MQDEMLTITEAARRLRCNRQTIWRMLRDGALPGLRIGRGKGVWRIRAADLAAATMPKRGRPAKEATGE